MRTRPTITSTPAARRGPRARRGSVYAVVLAMAILVSLIGLSAVAVGRINLRTASAASDAITAEELALSAVETAATTVNTSNWRTLYLNDQYSTPLQLNGGSLCWKVVDEADGDLTNGGLQPIRVFGYGRAGAARRAFSVRFVPSGANLISNNTIESGTSSFQVQGSDCTLDAPTDDPHWGLRYLRVRNRTGNTAGPQQDVTLKINANKRYYVEAWVKMTTSADQPVFSFIVKKSGSTDPPYAARGVDDKGNTTVGLQWTRVNAAITPNWSGIATSVYFRIETLSTAQDLKIDDLKVIEESSPTAMAPSPGTWQQEPYPNSLP